MDERTIDLGAALEIVKQSCAVYRFMEIELLAMEEGVFRVRTPLTSNTANHVNIMHASMLFATAEILGGLVAMRHVAKPETFQPVVREVKISYLKPAFSAATAEARFTAEEAAEMNAQLDASGKFDFDLMARVTDERGETVAETLGAYAIRNFAGG
ncbi:MAG: PaaI family thioesterase [Pseudomonadota bacterium]